MIRVVPIKPGPLQVLPMRAVLKNAMQRMGADIADELTATTAYWTTPLVFKASSVRVSDREMRIQIMPADPTSKGAEIFNYLDKGTKPHIIKAKKPGGSLRWKTGSAASATTGSTDAAYAFAKHVHHPGTKARNWTRTMTNRWQQNQREYLGPAMTLAAEMSGHRQK